MRLALAILAVALPLASRATGGHDAVGCAGCHSMHSVRGEALFTLPPNTKVIDPRTGKPNGALSALCLSCHADPDEGGQGTAPASQHFGHPFSKAMADVNPKLARVPPELVRGGRFECVACHDPHPSNPNYRYLRIAVTRTPTLSELCTVCHPRKADPAARRPSLYSSMDERAARPSAPAP